MTDNLENTDQLVNRAAGGDLPARRELLRRHRTRLTRMVALRMDPRVRARFDPSDVIQDALVTADQRLSGYLREQPLPFYPWLRKIAWERLLQLHEQHIGTQKRSVGREVDQPGNIRNDSVHFLADLLVDSVTAPSAEMIREEMRRRVSETLVTLRAGDREILELLYLEQLTSTEAAAILEVTPEIVRKRHFRAIRRLSQLLEDIM